MDGTKEKLHKPALFGAVIAYLVCLLTAFSAIAHEQQAVSGGKRVQPTPEAVQERTKEHRSLENQRREMTPPQKLKKDRVGNAEESDRNHTRGSALNRK